ncbi:Uncharacterised protein [Porphyromonas macacae]|uniref:Uncharacterized protein n=1 Tax=Porphyromonas macacae TaxID=28115 RepID=A0A379DG66_9PORP|nr:Uncharacterised protein [Porphyromonas macacae]
MSKCRKKAIIKCKSLVCKKSFFYLWTLRLFFNVVWYSFYYTIIMFFRRFTNVKYLKNKDVNISK